MKYLVLSLLFLGLSQSPTAFACSCAESNIAEEYAYTPHIFSGKVTEITRVAGPEESDLQQYKVTLKVIESFKGASPSTMVIHTATDSSMCGIDFRLSQNFLVFAYDAEEEGNIQTNLCTRTAYLNDPQAKDDIDWIRKYGRPTNDRLSGCLLTKATYSGEMRFIEIKNTCSFPIHLKALDVYWSKNIRKADTGFSSLEKELAPFAPYERIHSMKRNSFFGGKSDYKYKLYWSGLENGDKEKLCDHWMAEPGVLEKVCL